MGVVYYIYPGISVDAFFYFRLPFSMSDKNRTKSDAFGRFFGHFSDILHFFAEIA
jgi:hypothetical protein